jgi:hypothetical protein
MQDEAPILSVPNAIDDSKRTARALVDSRDADSW